MNFNNLNYDELDNLAVQNLIFDTKELGSILKAHLFIERLIESLIKEKLENPESLFRNQLSFNLKVDLAHSLGILPERLISPIKSLNSIRNKYAHKLDYQVSFEELNSIKLGWENIQDKAFEAAKKKGIEDAVMIACLFLCWSLLNSKNGEK
ncbi:hypothetical protein MKJ04_16745 [Pontibacter sp. E15-1]|uniref:hypothetical protein n=1 Tax=Pontibacter sp. E15-1 TaxID=2919918 RepID=UPI001F500E42|nr:hypothetical protein [Pontibacter sp. E15-1]MCJ8166495.1 hypothetical protein [Pontibacter sp. E15-1]